MADIDDDAISRELEELTAEMEKQTAQQQLSEMPDAPSHPVHASAASAEEVPVPMSTTPERGGVVAA